MFYPRPPGKPSSSARLGPIEIGSHTSVVDQIRALREFGQILDYQTMGHGGFVHRTVAACAWRFVLSNKLVRRRDVHLDLA